MEPKDEISSAFTAEEVEGIVVESAREGLLAEYESGLTSRVIQFSERVAGEVAVPVGDLVTLGTDATPRDLERLVAKRGFSRYPVRGEGGRLTGYLHLKDILYAEESERNQPVPAKRVRHLATVGPGDEVEDVLESMRESGAHLARVVDTDGEVTGVVFLEDVIEELVGEVTDTSRRGP